ncbi:MAG: helix-turn-helix transcriptional regulator [Gammaproteobacteria bacterium]|nr:helix-turn-helix transcriptional regulator [Gammaproteobacteria bacterium]
MVKRPLKNRADEQDELVIKAINSSDRRQILDILRDEPRTTGAICGELPWLNRCTVMQHLWVLEKVRLIITRKAGRQRWNYPDVSPIQHFHERWIKAYAEPSASFLSRLRTDLETS